MFSRGITSASTLARAVPWRAIAVEASMLNEKHIPNPHALKWIQHVAKLGGAKTVHIAEGTPLDTEALERDVFDQKIEVGFRVFSDASRRTLSFANGAWQINDKKLTSAELDSHLERSLSDRTLYVVPYLLGRSAGLKLTDNPLIVLTATRFDSMGQSAWEAMGSRDSFERILHCSKLQIFPDEPETAEKIKMSYSIHSGNVGAPNPEVPSSPFSTAPRRGKDE